MLTYDLKVGQAIQLGDVACLAFDEKSGNRIKVRIATKVEMPITLIATGIIPRVFVRGIDGVRRPYNPPATSRQTVAA